MLQACFNNHYPAVDGLQLPDKLLRIFAHTGVSSNARMILTHIHHSSALLICKSCANSLVLALEKSAIWPQNAHQDVCHQDAATDCIQVFKVLVLHQH